MTAPAACAACNDHVRCVSTAIDTPAAAIQAPGFRKPMISLDDTFSKAQTDRRTTQLLAPGETPSPSQLNQPSRRGCGAVPSRWASRVLPASVRCEEQARGTARARRSRLTKIFCSRQDHYTPYPHLRLESASEAAHTAKQHCPKLLSLSQGQGYTCTCMSRPHSLVTSPHQARAAR